MRPVATDTVRTLLAHAFPGADSALDDRTGGDHFQVTAVSSAFDDRGQKARRGGLEVGFPAPKGFYPARASALSAQIGQGHSSRRCSNV